MKAQWKSLLAVGALAAVFVLAGCDGDTGPAGPQGDPGADGTNGTDGANFDDDPVALAIAAAKPESCATCHSGIGTEHQANYDDYRDSNLTLAFDSVVSVAAATGFDVTATFTITLNGMPYVDAAGLPGLDQKRFYAVEYTGQATGYLNSCSLNSPVVVNAAAGQYSVTGNCSYQPELSNAQVYGYIADTPIFQHEGGTGAELPAGTHIHLYSDVANAAAPFGTAAASVPGSYQSLANVAGCEKCHGEPYLKHGFRAAIVPGLPDFAACKSCHYDDREGGHEDWQWMVDDPLGWATGALTNAELEAAYPYTANLMNDVHMAHAMEFPYPQSMANCATCHEGNLGAILADTNFTVETCKSCHPIQGIDAWPQIGAEGDPNFQAQGKYYQQYRAPAFEYLWQQAGVDFHDPVAFPNCQGCHGAGAAPSFTAYHQGYDKRINDPATGERYADIYTVSIDDIFLDATNSNLLTVEFSANDPDVNVELLISFYGWDTKNFIVASHERDDSRDVCSSTRGCRYEIGPDETNPLFTNFAEVAPGSWTATADLSAWQGLSAMTADGTPMSITDLIAAGKVRKAEITVTPTRSVNGVGVGLNAATQTFDLGSGLFVEDYFKGTDAIVDTAKCNVCHDQLAVTFHNRGEGSGRGGDIVACRNCHNPTFRGSHLEMASRSIENYVHAIHSFQPFDPADDFDTFDPVIAKRYDQHISHVFPNFTITNCEACHVTAGLDPDGDGPMPAYPVTYNVPDQSKTMPGLLSGSDDPATWYFIDNEVGSPTRGLAFEDPAGRAISGNIGQYVVGPASRACGGCHRADKITADDPGGLASFNAHTEAGGTYVSDQGTPEVLFKVIDKIMSMFE